MVSMRIRIQHFRSMRTGPGSWDLMTKISKILKLKKVIFWSKIAIMSFLGLHEGLPSYRSSFSHQKRTSLFSFFGVISSYLQKVQNQCGSGSTTIDFYDNKGNFRDSTWRNKNINFLPCYRGLWAWREEARFYWPTPNTNIVSKQANNKKKILFVY